MTKMTLLKYLPWLVMLCGLGGNAWADGVDEPIPSFYQEAGISKTRSYINQNDSEHIDPFTGKLQHHFVDVFIPGNGGMDLKVQRSYNSVNDLSNVNDIWISPHEKSPIGIGWTMHFGRVLKWTGANICDAVNIPGRNAVFELPDGSRRILYPSLSTTVLSWVTTDFWRADCGSAGVLLVIYSPDGTKYEMTSATAGMPIGTGTNVQNTYYVSKITDRNGNWFSFTYQNFLAGTSGVKTVTSSDGRSLVFNYVGSNLSTITDSTGAQTLASYTYSAANGGYGYLTEVLRPHGQKWQFAYHASSPGQHALSQITYPTGGTIDYTYGLVQFANNLSIPKSTVITKKVTRTNDIVNGQISSNIGDTWTYVYKPATEALLITDDPTRPGWRLLNVGPCSATDVNLPGRDSTVVTGPEGSHFYNHVGYNSISPGFVFVIGKQFCGGNDNEIYAPRNSQIEISSQKNIRPGDTSVFDDTTVALLNAGRFVGRYSESFDTRYSDFDSWGNPATITETGNSTKVTNVTYNIDPLKWNIRQKKDETVTEGTETLATTRTFDTNGNMLTETHAGVPTSYTYYPTGDIASRTDARLKITQFSNYRRGIPQSEQQPESVSISRVVNDAGNVTSETDGVGTTTSYSYDGLNRVTGITHPTGNPVSVVWGTNSRTVTRGTYVAETTFDGFGQEIKSQHTGPQTITQTYKVDALGRRIFSSYPNSSLGTKYSYDMLNRVTLVFNEYDPSTDSYANSQSNFYSGFSVRKRNERGINMLYKYRAYGNPDKTELLETSHIAQFPGTNLFGVIDVYATITRNIAGQMTSVTQDGVSRSYTYNPNYHLTSVTEPETGITTLGRDAVGNLISKQVGNSGLTSYAYDDRNRLTGITYPAGTPPVINTYFKDDKLKSVNNSVAKREYVYDANKNLTNETLTIGAKEFPLVYGYNANDASTFIRYGSNRTVTYAPDAFGRPTQASPYVSSVEYHPSGHASKYTFANGVVSSINLNERQWPNGLKIAKTANLFNMSYSYDGVGNVTSIIDDVDSRYNKSLEYDEVDRLIKSNQHSIYHNLNGDILNQNQNWGSSDSLFHYEYDATKRRLTNVSGFKAYSMQYDTYGNVTNNGKNIFSYNDASHMKCANCGTTNEVLYVYDGNGIRVNSKKNNMDTFYMYGLSGQLLWEETPNVSLKEYIYLGGKQIATREQILP